MNLPVPDGVRRTGSRFGGVALWLPSRAIDGTATAAGRRSTGRRPLQDGDRLRTATASGRRPPTLRSGGPGLLLDDEVALDREDAAAFGQIEQLDQVGIDVQLVAVLAQPARDPEAEPLAPVAQAKRRVEARDDETA
jgi:hypothetical protein